MPNYRRSVKLLVLIMVGCAMLTVTLPHDPVIAAGPTPTPTIQPTPHTPPQPSVLVNSLLDDPNGCPSICTLRSAINTAPPGGVVGFVDTLKGSIKLADVIEITKDVTIVGRGTDVLAIDGQKQVQLFVIKSGTVKFYGLKLQNAMSKRVGGAIEVQSGNVELYDSLFEANTSNEGGAVSVNGNAKLTIANVIFNNNNATGGGALYAEISSTVTITDSLFQNNTATNNAGAFSNRGKTQLTRTSFVGNKVHRVGTTLPQGGGAIFNLLTGRLTITACIFTKNQSDGDGGAIANNIGTSASDLTQVVIDSSTFNENVAEHLGGAIANYLTSPLTLTNSTIAGNLAKDSGGGLLNQGVMQIQSSTIAQNGAVKSAGGIFIDKGTVSLTSSIVAGNIGKPVADISGKVKSGGSNLIGNPNGTSGLFASDQQNVDPKLQPITIDVMGYAPVMALSPGSPAIGKGGSACPPTDERGVKRKNPCDAGAFETTP